MTLRERQVAGLGKAEYDTLIIGGGINGAAAAAALAAKGARVALIDQGDFAGGASSNSSNFVWGGIKYLESGEYSLVWKLCKSRNLLMRSYPDTVKEVRFLVIVQKGFRRWPVVIFLGALLYWLMGRCFTAMPRYYSARKLRAIAGPAKLENAVGGVEYSDCCLADNDARFVYKFIESAVGHGCVAANYVQSLGAERVDGRWRVRARDLVGGGEFTIQSKILLNAAGPHTDDYNKLSGQTTRHRHLFSKGVHLTVRGVDCGGKVLTFFAADGRMFFVIPMGAVSCIGTTDTPVTTPEAEAEAADVNFVLDNANRFLNLDTRLTGEHVIAVRCGVRPLAVQGEGSAGGDWLHLSRKHAIDVDRKTAHLSIFGGKLSDCTNIGEEVADIVSSLGVDLPHSGRVWYGEPDAAVREKFFRRARVMDLDARTPPASPEPLSQRLWRRYGEAALELLDAIEADPADAEPLIPGTEYLSCEVALSARREMVVTLEDFLRRRTGLAMERKHEDLCRSPGLKEICRILFAEQGDAKLGEYVGRNPASWV